MQAPPSPDVEHFDVEDEVAPDDPHAARGLIWRIAFLALAVVALAAILIGAESLQRVAWIVAVLVAGLATLGAAAAVDGATQAPRWRLQGIACAAIMLELMASGPGGTSLEPLAWALAVAAAAALVLMATVQRGGGVLGASGLYLVLDAAIVGTTVALGTLAVDASSTPVLGAALLLGSFAAAGYSVTIATRSSVRQDPRGADGLFLIGVLLLCLHEGAEAASHLDLQLMPNALASPGLALLGVLAIARSPWVRAHGAPGVPSGDLAEDSRLRLLPALAAAGALVILSSAELAGQGSRAGFFGVVLLFSLIVGRLMVTLLENRQLLQRVERSGVFEEKLRDLGAALLAALDRNEALGLVCRTAQMALRADSVMLWMVDSTTYELEAVEVLSNKRRSLLMRRLPIDDSTSLAARVSRTGESEIITHVPSSSQSNGFLNVLLRAQCLLAVPVARGNVVQGVLVCIDSRNPTAYGRREQAKAELLASQVAVALDNAYQHSLQRRRVEELTALYKFAQSAHAAQSSSEIVRQLLPIVKERLKYTYAMIWLREDSGGTLRLVAADAPAETPTASLRPSSLAMRALATGSPSRAGLGWGVGDTDQTPDRTGIRSQLSVPLVLKRRVVGVVDLESRYHNAYSLNEERLLGALANHAALAVDNLHLLEESRKVAALKELDRMKTELLSTVSHELRTPLGSIKGYATTLLTHETKLRRDERREFLEIIDSEADRLTDLIENLLNLSRLEAGMLRIEREPQRLGKLASDVARKVQLAAPNHQVDVVWPSQDGVVSVDARRIYQVMQNLLTNAVKYSPEGGRISLVGEVTTRDLVVSVTDEGLGMPAAELDRIFERFHRVGGEVSRRVGGTGLGLAICKGLVEAHGGRIWAESGGEGKGSTFRYTLPLVSPVAEPATSRSKGAHDHEEANRTRR